VASTLATSGFGALIGYAHLLAGAARLHAVRGAGDEPGHRVLETASQPYPLVLMCLRESGITAFFTRSSAANIPVNLA
jgi:serine/threonine transporter